MLTVLEFIQLREVLGIPITYTTAKPPVVVKNLKAIVQPVNSRDEALVNSYGVGAKTIQILASDLPIAPLKFDTVLCQNERMVIDTVVTQNTRGTGAISFYLCYVKGK
jgi:hypothetical protein